MTKNRNSKIEYECDLKKYLHNKTFDEDYALLTHYIQLGDIPESKRYGEKLEKEGIDVNELPETERFNKQKKIIYTPRECKFTFVDLFAGIGGFRLAMQEVGGKCVFSSEWDEAAKQTYYNNYGEVPFGDITKEETKQLMPDYFDVLCAEFPCQPFSNAGLKKGIVDTRGTLFYHIAEILRDHQPKAVFLENVKGLISNDGGKTIRTVLRTITDMGYRCNISAELLEKGSTAKLKTECSKMVLSAKDYGVPLIYPQPPNKKICVGSILFYTRRVNNAA